MNAARQFYSQNSGLVQNVMYLLALYIVVYLVYSYLTAGADMELYIFPPLDLSQGGYGVPGNQNSALIPTGGSIKTEYPINYDSVSNAAAISNGNFVNNPLLRITEGGVFTFSWWMYINSWDNTKSGVIKPIFTISDPTITMPTDGTPPAYVVVAFLYPSTNMLGVRVHTMGVPANELTWQENFLMNAQSAATAGQTFTNTGSTPVCDINDVDMQRWINFTIVISGRVLDVYYDGKLNRSCVLPGPVAGSQGGKIGPGFDQVFSVGQAGGFNGSVNSVFFAATALTPERIYGLYQTGPQGATSLVRALFSKLGINLNYNGANTWANYL